MKYVIFADVHSNLEAFNAAVRTFPAGDDTSLVFAGDIVGYGANPNECMELFISLNPESVLGNHDAAVIDKTDVTNFNEYAAGAVLWTKDHLTQQNKDYLRALPLVREEKLFTVCHGTLHNPESFTYMMSGADAMHTFELMKTKICFVAHSHIPGIFTFRDGQVYKSFKEKLVLKKEEKYIINVGSIGQPRDNDNRSSYCTYDPDKDEVKFHRVEYDIKIARKKIINAGLPPILGDRLLVGR